MTDDVTVSVKSLYLILAPKASWIPEAPRHFEESQWGPENRASEERDGLCLCVCVCVCVCFLCVHGDGMMG